MIGVGGKDFRFSGATLPPINTYFTIDSTLLASETGGPLFNSHQLFKSPSQIPQSWYNQNIFAESNTTAVTEIKFFVDKTTVMRFMDFYQGHYLTPGKGIGFFLNRILAILIIA